MTGGRHSTALPVFLDRSGHRRRALTVLGAAVGVVLLTFLGLLVAGAMTGGAVPLPGWPDPGARAHQDGESGAEPTPSPAPGATPGQSGGTTGTGTPAPAPATSADRPGQGDEHRNTAPPRSTRSPGKP